MSEILIIACSERDESFTLRCAQLIESMLSGSKVLDLRDYHLDLFDGKKDTQANLPSLKESFRMARQVLFVSPEYNWSISPNAKNLIDYLSFEPELWDDKVFACFGCSAGRGGRLPIIELWKIINKLISFSHAISILSPYHVEFNAGALDDSKNFSESFQSTLRKALDHHQRLAKRFQG
ncbi:MAG: NAD(P)H-dependent oxidoreductase [Candidatus Caenarcaniphilales bacterium]|nr:NAD(P)H-dependent oxidoreductase [Candidatus Caenarcaniphilales bacterium]